MKSNIMRQIVWESHIILITFAGWKKPVSLFLKEIGWNYLKFEEMGIISPVIDVQCQYKNTTTFADKVMIETTVKKFSDIKLILQYEMKNEVGKIVALAESAHCFLDKDGKMLRLAK